MYDLYKNLVFDWLDTISKGTNKPVVKELLNAKGVSYTFDIPRKLATKLFNDWQNKKK